MSTSPNYRPPLSPTLRPFLLRHPATGNGPSEGSDFPLRPLLWVGKPPLKSLTLKGHDDRNP